MDVIPQFLWQEYPEVQKALSDCLGLYWDETMQDWDLINSDSENIDYWLDFYEKLSVPEEKYTLMQLLIVSFDDYQNYKSFNLNLWNRCANILEKEHYLHISIIYNWSSYAGKANFFISEPYMDFVFEKVKFHYY